MDFMGLLCKYELITYFPNKTAISSVSQKHLINSNSRLFFQTKFSVYPFLIVNSNLTLNRYDFKSVSLKLKISPKNQQLRRAQIMTGNAIRTSRALLFRRSYPFRQK